MVRLFRKLKGELSPNPDDLHEIIGDIIRLDVPKNSPKKARYEGTVKNQRGGKSRSGDERVILDTTSLVVSDDLVTLGLVKFDVSDFLDLFSSSDIISQLIVEADNIWPLLDREIKKIKSKNRIVAIYVNVGIMNEDLLTENVMKNINLVIKGINESANARWAFRIDKHLEKKFRINIVIGKSMKLF